ncbi:kinase-like domain-containing protein [Rhizophagus clarus]|uniref:Kinase-like domain-containing protein n=1 Tax=Rhizophagus clarus TaxID=94130 RepID=A0A8H3L9R9_9GLOM|nr:kinase-like domain-containing protein [Rhizophagus clarus]
MLVMQYASGGDLHNWLQKKFAEIKWNKDKLIILWQISEGPSAKIIRTTFGSWSFRNKNKDIFDKSELIRKELLKSEKLGPEFAKNPHPKAIYTSRPLSSFISKCSSVNSSSSISLYINKQDYNYASKEQEFDIDIKSKFINSLAITSNKRSIEESNIEIYDNNGTYLSDQENMLKPVPVIQRQCEWKLIQSDLFIVTKSVTLLSGDCIEG